MQAVIPFQISLRISLQSILAVFLLLVSPSIANPVADSSKIWEAWITPHESFSSSIGVLGCKINTNRVAYWPMAVDCDNLCVEITHPSGRSLHVLRIDQSGGAYDVSYDAYNYLVSGKGAKSNPIVGGPVQVQYRNVDIKNCLNLITDGKKLPLTASNAMNYVSSCMDQKNSWVGKNFQLYNILDSICTWGFDEKCSVDLATSNQPSCPNTLGLTRELKGKAVKNIQYGTGLEISADTRTTAPATGLVAAEGSAPLSASEKLRHDFKMLWALVVLVTLLMYGV